MREIKFRLWDKYFKFMDYDFSNNYLITNDGKVLEKVEKRFADQYWHEYEEDKNCVLMQYTGLKDKNGKGIYEGDIVKGKNYGFNTPIRYIGTVEYVYNKFKVIGLRDKYKGTNDELNTIYEVIGNIYENPELL